MGNGLATLARAVRDGEEKRVESLVALALSQDLPAELILNEGLVAGLREIGELFERGESFLPEMLVAAEAMNRGAALLEPGLLAQRAQARGRVVIGSVQGDLHDIGKNLVAMLLKGNGFEVHDLGVDVAADQFVTAVATHEADILAMSALLSTTAPRFQEVVTRLTEEGRRHEVRVLIGGAAATAKLAARAGADGYAPDCVAAVSMAISLMQLDVGA